MCKVLLRLHCRVSEQSDEDSLLIGDSAQTVDLTDGANTSASSAAAAADRGEVTSDSDGADLHTVGLSTSIQSSAVGPPCGI